MQLSSSFSSSTHFKKAIASLLLSASLFLPDMALARPEGVNKPELLPSEYTTVIDLTNFLTKGEEKKIKNIIADLESKTGFKLRILCQSYPNTPGAAIKDFWKTDDKTIVLVADKGQGFSKHGLVTNMINLNIGSSVEGVVPNLFWSRLKTKLGNAPYIQEKGEDVALLNAVEAINYCLQSRDCRDLPFTP
eukprot:scaffold300_cov173-Ochromonas_danica.AAC.15